MTAPESLSVPDRAQFAASSALQKLLPEIVALTLDVKQAHWNVTGPAFFSLHALTDDLATDARTWSDRVAERVLALGFTVDARPRTVAAVASQFPGGWIGDDEATAKLIDVIDGVAATAYRCLADLERIDPVAHSLVVEILEVLEKYRWMLGAQLTGQHPVGAGNHPGRSSGNRLTADRG